MPAAEQGGAPRLEADLVLDRKDFRLEASLDVRLSGVTAIFGPSGCGKTTFLRAIAGLEREPRGRIVFDATVWQDDRTFVAARDRRAGLVFQDARLFSTSRCGETSSTATAAPRRVSGCSGRRR